MAKVAVGWQHGMGVMVPCDSALTNRVADFWQASKHVNPPARPPQVWSNFRAQPLTRGRLPTGRLLCSWRRKHTTLRSLRRSAVPTVLLPSNTKELPWTGRCWAGWVSAWASR